LFDYCSDLISHYNCLIIADLGDANSDDESDPANIFEPVVESVIFQGKNTIFIDMLLLSSIIQQIHMSEYAARNIQYSKPIQHVFLIGSLDTMQDEQTIHDDDEECRIFSGQGDLYNHILFLLKAYY
jgi:hypothetical protein